MRGRIDFVNKMSACPTTRVTELGIIEQTAGSLSYTGCSGVHTNEIATHSGKTAIFTSDEEERFGQSKKS